jgi:hypothetical protein
MILEKRYLLEPDESRGRSFRAVSKLHPFVRVCEVLISRLVAMPDPAGDCHGRNQFQPAKDAVSGAVLALGTTSGLTQTKGSFQTSNSTSSEQLEQS